VLKTFLEEPAVFLDSGPVIGYADLYVIIINKIKNQSENLYPIKVMISRSFE
jgi:hypothetical protein